MHPWMSQAVAQEHRRDLHRSAERHRQATAARRARPQSTRPSLDTRLGWLLIRIGCHLVALRVTPAEAGAVRSL